MTLPSQAIPTLNAKALSRTEYLSTVIVHSTSAKMAEPGGKPLTPRETRVTQHKVCPVKHIL